MCEVNRVDITTLPSVAALSMSYFIPVIEALLMPVIESIPCPYLVIGVTCLIAIPKYIYTAKHKFERD